MKGIVFTEFLEMVEKEHGYEMVDALIEENDLPSGGTYTAVGTYSHSEMIDLLSSLSSKTATEIETLLHAFGKYIFDTFLSAYPGFFADIKHGFDFLQSIDGHIHKEVKKLYPDAVLPVFETEQGETSMKMVYHSDKKMSSFALGLIEKTMIHYGHQATIDREMIEEDGSVVRFTISTTDV